MSTASSQTSDFLDLSREERLTALPLSKTSWLLSRSVSSAFIDSAIAGLIVYCVAIHLYVLFR